MIECLSDIHRLGRCKTHGERQRLLKNGKVIDALSEGSLNIMLGNVPLSTAKYNDLRLYKSDLELLANKRESRQRKRTRLLQRGGGLLTLLASVLIPTIASLLTR
jgi:hypothetical protein